MSKTFFLFTFLFCSILIESMADPNPVTQTQSEPEGDVHIIYTEKPETEEPEAYHIRTLDSVLGSEDAAKEKLLYSYKTAASGFSAKLTPEQVSLMSSKRSTPATPSSKIRRTPCNTPDGCGGAKADEEKILVTVRVRPLSPKELAAYDLVAWDCTDEHTIVFRDLNHERHTGPYNFDKVFDQACSTLKVYEEGAQDVAVSALNGINATIFTYGQTSSGKTFTMRGITENAVKDIYEHIVNVL